MNHSPNRSRRITMLKNALLAACSSLLLLSAVAGAMLAVHGHVGPDTQEIRGTLTSRL